MAPLVHTLLQISVVLVPYLFAYRGTLLMTEPTMMNVRKSSGLDQSAFYSISIYGALDQSWSERLEGLRIEVVCCADGLPSTLLSGWLQDQAALNGVLTTLYGLGFSLRSVTAL